MQMHYQFLICANNGWLSTCNSKRSDPMDAEGAFRSEPQKNRWTQMNSYLGIVGLTQGANFD